MRFSVVFVMVSLAAGLSRPAEACAPTVRLGGDPVRVVEVSAALAARGVETTTSSGCPAVAVILEARGKTTLVSMTGSDDRVLSRAVTDARTAATVIESWVRTDVEAPLLARRGSGDEDRQEDRHDGGATPSPSLVAGAPPVTTPGLSFATLAETSVANDRTTWVGFELGACSGLGPACAGGRVRVSTVADGPGEWERKLDREAVDALVGGDLPLRVGSFTAASGLGVGLGWTHTHEESSTGSTQTFGLRAETRLRLSYPVTRHAAAEASLAFAVGQRLHTSSTTSERLPDDPRLLGHVGLGVRFDGP